MSYTHEFSITSGDAEELDALIRGLAAELVGVVVEGDLLTAEFSAQPVQSVLDACQSALDAYASVRPMQVFLDGLEVQRRRKIRLLKARVAVAMLTLGISRADVMAEGAAFYGRHGAAIYAWETGASQSLLTDIQADTATWLTQILPGGGTILGLFEAGLTNLT